MIRTRHPAYEVMVDSGIGFVMAEINIRYLCPARFDDLLSWVTFRAGRTVHRPAPQR